MHTHTHTHTQLITFCRFLLWMINKGLLILKYTHMYMQIHTCTNAHIYTSPYAPWWPTLTLNPPFPPFLHIPGLCRVPGALHHLLTLSFSSVRFSDSFLPLCLSHSICFSFHSMPVFVPQPLHSSRGGHSSLSRGDNSVLLCG